MTDDLDGGRSGRVDGVGELVMQEDDPAELDRYREEALRLELQRYASRFHPAADFYTIAARFALNKLKLAEAGADPMGAPTFIADAAADQSIASAFANRPPQRVFSSLVWHETPNNGWWQLP